MTYRILTFCLMSAMLFSIEIPWQRASIGILGGSATSATFEVANVRFGMDAFSFTQNVDISGEDDYGITAALFIPRVGYRYDISSVDRINTYYFGEGYIALPYVDLDGFDDDEQDEIDDILDDVRVYGMKFGYGVEYKFNNQLSFSADIGFNLFMSSIDADGLDVQQSIGLTSTRISLNFMR